MRVNHLDTSALLSAAQSSVPADVSFDSRVRSKRGLANRYWFELAAQNPISDLPALVGEVVGVTPSQVTFWASSYGWDEDVIALNDCPNRRKRTPSDTDEIDFDELADDPLLGFYEQFRTSTGSRRHITALFSEAGYASPVEADLSLYKHLLDRYPLSANDAASAIGQDPTVFVKYAAAHGISPNQKYEKIAISLGSLILRDDRLAAIVARHATHVYTTRATPVRTLAIRIGIRWTDLWAMGCRFSEWTLPSQTVLDRILDLFSDYPVGS